MTPDSELNQPQNHPQQPLSDQPPLSTATSPLEVSNSSLSGSDHALKHGERWPSLDSANSGLASATLPGDWPRGKYAATGGAVGAVALGLWALITFWLTDWTMLNALVGLALGFWGLQSPRQKIARLGLGLNLLALLACLVL